LARRPRPLTQNMLDIMSILRTGPVVQTEIYEMMGQAEAIGSVLWAMERRGLIACVRPRLYPGQPTGTYWALVNPIKEETKDQTK
jgi:hypothetical protein